MAANTGGFKIVQDQDTALSVDWADFMGIDIQADQYSRPPNSWRRAENVDLFIPGAVRKIVGPEKAFGPFGSTITEMFSFLPAAASTLLMLGYDNNGHIINLQTGQDYGEVAYGNWNPFIAIMGGTSQGGEEVNYVIVVPSIGAPVKWNPTDGPSPLGVFPPDEPLTVIPTFSATNAHAYFMQVGIQYLWTYFNPTTLHESSPSVVGIGSIITPTVNTPPPATPYITQVEIQIPTPPPNFGTGYTRIRVYRTQDGGATFYLLPIVYDSAGDNLSDVSLSVAIQGPITTVFDGLASIDQPPSPDQVMVNPPGGAPAIGANDPPPEAIWGAVYQSRLWLLDQSTQRRLWFSNIGDFQSFGVYNYFDFSKDIEDQITGLVALSDRMIVFGKNSARQITGTDFSSFVEVPIDMRRGCKGYRSSVNDGDKVYALSPQALVRLSFSEGGPPFIGDKIKPITDQIVPLSFPIRACMDIDSIRGILFFFFNINSSGGWNNEGIAIDLSRAPNSPFTSITGLPTEVIAVRELEAPDGTKDIYFAGLDNNVYRIYSKATPGVGTFVATLETQQLPLDSLDIWNVYRRLTLYGQDLFNWQVQYSVDGVNFSPTPPLPYFYRTQIGYSGPLLVVRFIHSVNPKVATAGALLSKGLFTYTSKMSRG